MRRNPVAQLAREHWARYGRNYYARHDYEAIETAIADRLMTELKGSLASLPGRQVGDLTIAAADDFSYSDPVDGSVSPHQGVRLFFEDGSRTVFRLSGTGTEGATLRVYLERYESPEGKLGSETATMLAKVAAAADAIAGISRLTGRTAPDVVT